ncbi:regulatory protein RecX [Cellvibrio mixtus]|uniref:regulatory protein RecX n=1 Tax=Cellvibrio mixtus TaxID=39650 RepID=UPI000693682A|nr:regulatory protein RecX [Cellvibrio mixtus]
MPEQITLPDLRMAAMNLLAMREHSVKELTEKLERKFPGSGLVEQVINKLAEQNLQSDERFAVAFIAMRQRQGKGSALIRMELRDKGISSELIGALIDDADSIWFELAQNIRQKRFHDLPADGREKARQMRFLHSRGFAGRHIQAAFTGNGDHD